MNVVKPSFLILQEFCIRRSVTLQNCLYTFIFFINEWSFFDCQKTITDYSKQRGNRAEIVYQFSLFSIKLNSRNQHRIFLLYFIGMTDRKQNLQFIINLKCACHSNNKIAVLIIGAFSLFLTFLNCTAKAGEYC